MYLGAIVQVVANQKGICLNLAKGEKGVAVKMAADFPGRDQQLHPKLCDDSLGIAAPLEIYYRE